MKTIHQTVVIPQGAEGAEFLKKLLNGDMTWESAHALSPGDDISMEDGGHCGDCGECSKCYPSAHKKRRAAAKRQAAAALIRNRREDERMR